MALNSLLNQIWNEKPQKVLVMGEKKGEDDWGWSVLQVKVPKEAEAVELAEKSASLHLLGRENWRGKYVPFQRNNVDLLPITIESPDIPDDLSPKYLLTEKGTLYGLRQDSEGMDLDFYQKALEFLRVYRD
ncbi:hypothetical protein HZC30_00190 [Candidatus Woesearchaeota archaeon]|nr:hypothetical protein [Candidatus Woesearchaeota archaeon]